MTEKGLSRQLQKEIMKVEKLLDEAQRVFQRVHLEIKQLEDRLKALKELARSVDREKNRTRRKR